jgi:hypothetical protein
MRLLWKYTVFVFQTGNVSINQHTLITVTSNSASSSLSSSSSSSSNGGTNSSSTSDKKNAQHSGKQPQGKKNDQTTKTESSSIPMDNLAALLQQIFQSWQRFFLCQLVLALSLTLLWLCLQIMISYNILRVVFVFIPLLVYLLTFYGIRWISNKRNGQKDSSDYYYLEKKTNSSSHKLKLDKYNAQPVEQFKTLFFSTFETTYYSTIFPLGFVGVS